MHTQTPSIRPKYNFFCFCFFLSLFLLFLPRHASLCNWLYTLVSWSRPKRCYPIIPSVTALQAHKHKDTQFGSLPRLIPIILPTNRSSAACKQVLFVFSDYKYCFGKCIIDKRRDRVYLSVHRYKTHNCTVRRFSFFICISCVFFLFWLQR